jgi:hypothetical protein
MMRRGSAFYTSRPPWGQGRLGGIKTKFSPYRDVERSNDREGKTLGQKLSNKRKVLPNRKDLSICDQIYGGTDVAGYVLFFSGQVDICYYADDHGYDKEYDTPHDIHPCLSRHIILFA